MKEKRVGFTADNDMDCKDLGQDLKKKGEGKLVRGRFSSYFNVHICV